ncbi:MAG: UDP-N-acetylglucosamine 1-carboxyvinyltransferase [Candidatus Omnitrophica bacterium]|nr:UDP-N-acetylglucosamine 1-carboxyvinyltransferase [Candidatus Omnitrophota bacterium]MDD5738002.1 UDP-N-acetylglucosamine 1-carboxyvinyltransferase [Candidatus Omnitrophota bacterium]
MDKIVIEGPTKLKGEVEVSGAKNSALPIMAATLLTDEKCVIKKVPPLRDVNTMVKILRNLGVRVHFEGGRAVIEPKGYRSHIAPYKYVKEMRASFCVLGPILAKHRKAQVSYPGGCAIGNRPVDLHLKGIKALGAEIRIEHGYVIAQAKQLKGAHIFLGGAFGSSVLATDNVMMAATLAKGRTVIENAACEPEVVDLADFLVKMGAKIKGAGTPLLEIEGVRRLGGAEYEVIPDRIEAGTFMIAAAITKGDLLIKGARFDHLGAVVDKLLDAGVTITRHGKDIRVRVKRHLKPVDITTLPYPGFPTDLQAQMLSLVSVINGISVITEKIYPDRYMHVSELARMGAQIKLEGDSAIVKGINQLSGAPVMASDLRASAALVLAGMAAKGRTDVSRVYHLDRGYDRIELKLSDVGANIRREKEE